MNNKWIYALFGVLVMGGVVFAISGATVGTETERGRWSGNTSGSIVTEGGNVSGVNVTAGTLTSKWASFYGNVTGSIVLADSAATNVYSWTWAAADGGEVCLSTDQSFDFASLAGSGTGANVDSTWSFTTTDADSATNTLTESCTVALDDAASVTSNTGVTLDSGFQTCSVTDTASPAAEGDFAFCVDIDSAGTNYNGEAADFEVMVPTSDGSSDTETYYFFVELN